MEYESIVQTLRDYFLGCPLLERYAVGVDWLPDHGIAFSVDPSPGSAVLQRYIGGDSIRQYLFVLRSIQDYGADVLQNLGNCGLFEALAEWMETQTAMRTLPDLGGGRIVKVLEAQSTGYLMTRGPDVGQYQIQCRLVYYQPAERRTHETV